MTTPKRGSDGSEPLQRRAKLGGGRRRERELRIRVDDQEYEEIHEAAMPAGLACSAFVIRTVRTAIREQRPLDGALVALHAELRNASRQVNAVGVNLNQLDAPCQCPRPGSGIGDAVGGILLPGGAADRGRHRGARLREPACGLFRPVPFRAAVIGSCRCS
ncbi:hypothetical protein [Actinomadura sp. GTD37]|uniref:plasmid mobilization protein n=1 Tax=Actinomadura sp. GTD37 TaxID=1778030 RepID=UPI0035C1D24F